MNERHRREARKRLRQLLPEHSCEQLDAVIDAVSVPEDDAESPLHDFEIKRPVSDDTIAMIEAVLNDVPKRYGPPWTADIDDEGHPTEMWTGKFYTGNPENTWETFDNGINQTSQRRAARCAKLAAVAVTALPVLIAELKAARLKEEP